jgi:hypothetical protein
MGMADIPLPVVLHDLGISERHDRATMACADHWRYDTNLGLWITRAVVDNPARRRMICYGRGVPERLADRRAVPVNRDQPYRRCAGRDGR